MAYGDTNFTNVVLSGYLTVNGKVADRRGAVLAAEHGAGAIGTALAPATYRWKVDDHIITEIQVDLTGLA